MIKKLVTLSALVLLLCASLPLVPRATGGSAELSGDFTYMKVDATRHLIYLSDTSANSVVVFNATSNSEVKSIFVGSQPQGMDISANGQELYVALSGASSLAVVNLTTLTLSRTIPLSIAPGDVAAGVQGRAYVTESDSIGEDWNYPVVVDTNASRQLGRITSGGLMFSGDLCIVSPNRQFLYIAEKDEEPSSIYKFSLTADNATLVAKSDFATNPEFINDISISPDGSRIYLAAGWPYFIDLRNSTDLTKAGELQTGPYPNSVSVTPDGGTVFASHETTEVDAFNATTQLLIGNYSAGGSVLMVRALSPTLVYAIVGSSDSQSRRLVAVETTPASWPTGSKLVASQVTDTSVTLEWNAASDSIAIVGYRICENGSLVQTTGNATETTIEGLEPNTHYVFQVQAEGGSGQWSGGPTVVVVTSPNRTPPPAPDLISPANGSTVLVTSPQFYWNTVYDPSGVTYTLQVDSNPNFLSPVINVTGIESLYFSGAHLAYGNYSWRVRATDGAGNVGQFSSVWVVRIESTNALVASILDNGSVSPGTMTTFGILLQNNGTVPERVTSVNITSDLGSFLPSSGLPFNLPAGKTLEFDFQAIIPYSAPVGDHQLSATVKFQYLDPATKAWTTPTQSPLSLNKVLAVATAVKTTSTTASTTSNSQLAEEDGLIGGGIAVAGIAIAIAIIITSRKGK